MVKDTKRSKAQPALRSLWLWETNNYLPKEDTSESGTKGARTAGVTWDFRGALIITY